MGERTVVALAPGRNCDSRRVGIGEGSHAPASLERAIRLDLKRAPVEVVVAAEDEAAAVLSLFLHCKQQRQLARLPLRKSLSASYWTYWVCCATCG